MQFFVCTFFAHTFFGLGVFSFAHFCVDHFFVHPFFRLVTFSCKYFNRAFHLFLRFNTCPGLWGLGRPEVLGDEVSGRGAAQSPPG